MYLIWGPFTHFWDTKTAKISSELAHFLYFNFKPSGGWGTHLVSLKFIFFCIFGPYRVPQVSKKLPSTYHIFWGKPFFERTTVCTFHFQFNWKEMDDVFKIFPRLVFVFTQHIKPFKSPNLTQSQSILCRFRSSLLFLSPRDIMVEMIWKSSANLESESKYRSGEEIMSRLFLHILISHFL